MSASSGVDLAEVLKWIAYTITTIVGGACAWLIREVMHQKMTGITRDEFNDRIKLLDQRFDQQFERMRTERESNQNELRAKLASIEGKVVQTDNNHLSSMVGIERRFGDMAVTVEKMRPRRTDGGPERRHLFEEG